MHTTATKIFFGTLLVFVPIQALAESPSKESSTQADWEFDRIQQFDPLTTDYGDRKSI